MALTDDTAEIFLSGFVGTVDFGSRSKQVINVPLDPWTAVAGVGISELGMAALESVLMWMLLRLWWCSFAVSWAALLVSLPSLSLSSTPTHKETSE